MTETLDQLVGKGTRIAFTAPMFDRGYFGSVCGCVRDKITIQLEEPQAGPAFGVGCTLEAHLLLPTRVLSFTTTISADNGRQVTISVPRSMLSQPRSSLRRRCVEPLRAEFRMLEDQSPSNGVQPYQPPTRRDSSPKIEALCHDIGPGGLGFASDTIPEPGARIEFWIYPGVDEEEIQGEGIVKGARSWPGATGFGVSLSSVSRIGKARLQKLLERPPHSDRESEADSLPGKVEPAA